MSRNSMQGRIIFLLSIPVLIAAIGVYTGLLQNGHQLRTTISGKGDYFSPPPTMTETSIPLQLQTPPTETSLLSPPTMTETSIPLPLQTPPTETSPLPPLTIDDPLFYLEHEPIWTNTWYEEPGVFRDGHEDWPSNHSGFDSALHNANDSSTDNFPPIHLQLESSIDDLGAEPTPSPIIHPPPVEGHDGFFSLFLL